MTDNRFDLVSALVAGCSDAPCFKTEPVPAEVLEQIIVAATRHSSERFPEPPWRFVIVVGEERERLIAGVTEALARHWGLGTVRPRGLASQSVLRAPAFILVFSRIPASEGLEALVHVASVAQNVVLLCASHGLATHRTHGSQLVPEAVLELVGDHLGPGIRGGDLVAMLAVGYPEEPGPEPAAGARPDWIGLSFAPQEERNEGLPPPPSTPAAVLRSAGDERVLVVDPYQYNRDLFHRVLSAAGYDVEVFSEGRTLLARLAGGDPAKLYIVSDSLPDMSGFELVRSLRGRAVSAALVATTARRDSAFRIGGLAAGVDYYLRKPINPIE
ncbi:MAG: response regulator, partial [Deltaproteobacteria bacterium]|nr:response regulator [Deltaproteobacteria bacterium]